MKVVLFAGAALVTGAAVFGAVRASQEATPMVVAKSKEVIRQVTQAELVESMTEELKQLRPLVAKCERLAAECERLRGELAAEMAHRAGYAAN